jgi:hypothetical protein
MVAGPLAVLALIVWLAGRTGPDQPHAAGRAVGVLLTAGPWAIGWLMAAVGFGWPLRRLLAPGGRHGSAIQIGLGVAVLLTLDAGLGALGLLQWGGSLGAWALLLAGVALVAEQARRRLRRGGLSVWPQPWLIWTAAPAAAVLLLAACSAPGWLWASEFGGYDALSYHLQLPKEWLTLGRAQPLSHNVYSYLPGYVEGAYYHLAVLIGDGIASAYACQLVHVGLTLTTAWAVGRFAAQRGGPVVGAAAAVVVLGTPWVVVVGSLGYNEMGVALLMATGLLVIDQDPPLTWRRGAALGLLAAAACGSKLTAAGFVAVPLGLLLMTAVSRRHWLGPIAAGVTGAICLSPFLLRNWAYAGNPVFPFATELLGLGHWTAEQADVWMRGHVAGTGFLERAGELWNQIIRYGLGPNPDPAEPWSPQWSLLPWLTAAGLLLGSTSSRLRGWSWRLAMVLAVQLSFWLLLTHIKSRFMLPAVVPAAGAVGIGLAAVADRLRSVGKDRVFVAVTGVSLLAWCCLPAFIFAWERAGAAAAMIGGVNVLTGDSLTVDQRQVLAETLPAVYLNHLVGPESRTLLVGEARPLYYRGRVTYQSTWDRGPLSDEMRRHPGDPQRWLSGLRDQGFTHLLINVEMLELWEGKGWNDPLLTADRVIDAAKRFAVLERDFGSGARLYGFGGRD